jgi:hypothetical protein
MPLKGNWSDVPWGYASLVSASTGPTIDLKRVDAKLHEMRPTGEIVRSSVLSAVPVVCEGLVDGATWIIKSLHSGLPQTRLNNRLVKRQCS